MAPRMLSADQLTSIAEQFRALAEPSRLRLLNALRAGEQSVTQLMDATELSQPNVSKHLQLLHHVGFVRRRKSGVTIFYRLADHEVSRLCDLMCDRLVADAAFRRKLFAR